LAGKVTTGLVESSGSLPPGDNLKGMLGSAPGLTLGNEYGRTLPLPYMTELGDNVDNNYMKPS